MQKDLKSIVNKILEGADVREVLDTSALDSLVAYGHNQSLMFKLIGDLYGIDSIVVDSDDSRTEFGIKDEIYCAPGDIVEIYSFLKKPFWDYFSVSGDTDEIGEGEMCSFIVPKGQGEGILKIGYFEAEDNEYDAHKIDLEYSKGWCKNINIKSFKVK